MEGNFLVVNPASVLQCFSKNQISGNQLDPCHRRSIDDVFNGYHGSAIPDFPGVQGRLTHSVTSERRNSPEVNV